MRKFNLLVTKALTRFGSKKIVAMKPVKVEFVSQQNKTTDLKTKSIQQSRLQKNKIPDDWETMQFDKLCSLNPQILRQLQIQIKKSKMNVNDQMFSSEHQVTNPEGQLTPYWVHIYKTLCNLKQISQNKIQGIKKQAYLAKMFLDQPQKDQKLIQVINRFVNNIHDVKKLEGIAEPTFCKYLLSLKRDLMMQGLNIQTHIDQNQKQIKVIQILTYQYQFWSDVKHNRAKNGTQQQYIIIKKKTNNPNTSITITEQHPQIDITYITRKKKRKQIQMSFVVKMIVQIQVDGYRHIVKVEKKGPSTQKINKQLRNQYIVIDYDNIYKGNPTIPPIFQF